MIYGANTCSPSTTLRSVGGQKETAYTSNHQAIIRVSFWHSARKKNLGGEFQTMLQTPSTNDSEGECKRFSSATIVRVSPVCRSFKLSPYVSVDRCSVSMYVVSLKYSLREENSCKREITALQSKSCLLWKKKKKHTLRQKTL